MPNRLSTAPRTTLLPTVVLSSAISKTKRLLLSSSKRFLKKSPIVPVDTLVSSKPATASVITQKLALSSSLTTTKLCSKTKLQRRQLALAVLASLLPKTMLPLSKLRKQKHRKQKPLQQNNFLTHRNKKSTSPRGAFLMPCRVAGLFRHGDYRHVVAVRRKFHTTIFHCRFFAGV